MADILRNVVGKQLLYGYSVYFTENGASVPYVLVGKGNNDNYLFMRRYAPSDKVAFLRRRHQPARPTRRGYMTAVPSISFARRPLQKVYGKLAANIC